MTRLATMLRAAFILTGDGAAMESMARQVWYDMEGICEGSLAAKASRGGAVAVSWQPKTHTMGVNRVHFRGGAPHVLACTPQQSHHQIVTLQCCWSHMLIAFPHHGVVFIGTCTKVGWQCKRQWGDNRRHHTPGPSEYTGHPWFWTTRR